MTKYIFSQKVSGVSSFVFVVIIFNTILITLSEFPRIISLYKQEIIWIEIICILIFCIEVVSKSYRFGWSNYIEVNWNKIDFMLVLLSLPILFLPFIEVGSLRVILVLRLMRFLRLMRVLEIIPKGARFVKGLKRALRASIGVAIGMVLLLFISALFSTIIFKDHAPEMFGNPLLSAYSMFRVFAITGWFEIPRNLLEIPYYNTVGWMVFIRCYFILFLLSGGMIGLSIFNATFIDALVEDNTEGIEEKLDVLGVRLVSIDRALDRINRKLKL